MKSLFEQLGGSYHQEGNYLIPTLPRRMSQNIRLASMGVCAAAI